MQFPDSPRSRRVLERPLEQLARISKAPNFVAHRAVSHACCREGLGPVPAAARIPSSLQQAPAAVNAEVYNPLKGAVLDSANQHHAARSLEAGYLQSDKVQAAVQPASAIIVTSPNAGVAADGEPLVGNPLDPTALGIEDI